MNNYIILDHVIIIGGGNLKQINQLLKSDKELQDKITELRGRVEKFAYSFTIPGYPDV